MVGVDVFRDWLLDLWIHWSNESGVSKFFQSSILFRLNVTHVGRMNTQVWMLNSLVRLAGWVNSELVTRNGRCSIQYRMAKFFWNVLPCVYSLSLPESQNGRMFLARSQESCLEITVLARIAESRNHRMFGNKNSFSCRSNLPFYVDKIEPKPYRGLPQAPQGTIIENITDRSKTVRTKK